MVQPEGNRRFERKMHNQEDNIKMDLQEVGCKGMDWLDLAHDRERWRALVHAVMKVRVPYNTGNF